MRAAVTSAWIVGINYVGGRKKRLHQMFLTSTDIDNIKTLTAEFTQIFWRRVNAVMHQKDVVQNILKSARFSPRSTLTLNNLIISLAAKVITKTIAMATIKKAHAIKDTRDYHIKSAQATEILTWVTQEDEKVCPFCDSLDGFSWHSDDPNILTPPDDAHENCRCRLDVTGNDEGGLGLMPYLPIGLAPAITQGLASLVTPPSPDKDLIPLTHVPAIVGDLIPKCPENAYWDVDRSGCVCNDGMHWDEELEECVDD